MSNVWFCSDPHFGHRNIHIFRPQFESAEEHDEFLCDRIASTVGKRDTLWILGDICFSEDAMKYVQEISRRVGYLRVVLGNHDTDNGTREKILRQLILEGTYDSIHGLTKYKEFWLSHCPMDASEIRGKAGNIHGHTHGAGSPTKQHFSVCMENIEYKPIVLSDLRERFYENSPSE